jgi:hypothetical protein
MPLFINMDVWKHILLKKWWIFPILKVSNKQSILEVLYVVYIFITSVQQKVWITMIYSSCVTASVLKNKSADVSIIFERLQNCVIHKI